MRIIKQISGMNGPDCAFWRKRQYDSWERLDKYGQPLSAPTASNDVILEWLMGGQVKIVDNAEFETPFPKVFWEEDGYVIAVAPTGKLARIERNLSLTKPNAMISAEVYLSGMRAEIINDERERVLKVYQLLSKES